VRRCRSVRTDRWSTPPERTCGTLPRSQAKEARDVKVVTRWTKRPGMTEEDIKRSTELWMGSEPDPE